jgi:hypothetical protein
MLQHRAHAGDLELPEPARRPEAALPARPNCDSCRPIARSIAVASGVFITVGRTV